MANGSPPKVSVCVMTYNHEHFIREALDSILSQEVNFTYEIVVGDDLSTDQTREILKEYSRQHTGVFNLLLYPEKVGVIPNFNAILQACQGEYIAILDGDDRMLPGKLQAQVDFLNSHPDFVMVGHEVRAFDSNTNETINIMRHKEDTHELFISEYAKKGNLFAHSAKMFRRSSLPPNGINKRIKYIADWYLHMVNAVHGRIGFIPKILGEYRVHSESILKTVNPKELYDDRIIVIEDIRKYYPNKFDKELKYLEAFTHLLYGVALLQRGQYKHARQELTRSIIAAPDYSLSQYYNFFKASFKSIVKA